MFWMSSSAVIKAERTDHPVKWCHFQYTECFDRKDGKRRTEMITLSAYKEVLKQNQEEPVP
jgi:hypothetical protein